MTGLEAVELIHQEAWTGRKPGLSRTKELLGRVGNPHQKLKYVHITGTNGKGLYRCNGGLRAGPGGADSRAVYISTSVALS